MNIALKQVGESILLIGSNNVCIASFSPEKSEYHYLKQEYDKEQAYINRYQDLSLEQLNQLHFDLSYDQQCTTDFNKQIEIGNEMRHVTHIYKQKLSHHEKI